MIHPAEPIIHPFSFWWPQCLDASTAGGPGNGGVFHPEFAAVGADVERETRPLPDRWMAPKGTL